MTSPEIRPNTTILTPRDFVDIVGQKPEGKRELNELNDRISIALAKSEILEAPPNAPAGANIILEKNCKQLGLNDVFSLATGTWDLFSRLAKLAKNWIFRSPQMISRILVQGPGNTKPIEVVIENEADLENLRDKLSEKVTERTNQPLMPGV